MERAEFDRLLADASDEELVDAIWEALPEWEDDEGNFDGDVIRVSQYASAEICNGGFFQFYANGIFDPNRIIECFEELEVETLAKCVRDSKEKFPKSHPPVRSGKEPINEKLEELGVRPKGTFDEIEGVYYAHVDALYASWPIYIRGHSEQYFQYLSKH